MFGRVLRLPEEVPGHRVMRDYYAFQTSSRPKAPGSHNLSTIPKLLAKDAKLLPMLYGTIDFKQWKRGAEDRASWITNIITPIYQA
jgi:hypothetical protein